MPNDYSTVPESALAKLGHTLYQRALVRREDEAITDPRGQPIGWLLDTRTPMLDGEVFLEAGRVLADRLRSRGIDQVAGFGYGAFPLVTAVLANGTPERPFGAASSASAARPTAAAAWSRGPWTASGPSR